MNSTDIAEKNKWLGTFYEKITGDHAYISIIFSWQLQEAIKRINLLKNQGLDVIVGGPAAVYAGIDSGLDLADAVSWHNPDACRTSKGCPFHCEFCINQNIEYHEYDNWIPRPIVIDDNITAGSVKHFDKVIDSLKQFDEVDFNQGISAALVNSHHADRLKELNLKYIRMAWDNINYESKFMRGWDVLRRAGFPRSKIAVYVLIGFNDTPDDARYRLEMVRRLGGIPFCMRYQPLDTPKRNSWVGDNWTHPELQRYCRYWNSLRVTSRVPFDEFQNNYCR
jgi:hypothetical protein